MSGLRGAIGCTPTNRPRSHVISTRLGPFAATRTETVERAPCSSDPHSTPRATQPSTHGAATQPDALAFGAPFESPGGDGFRPYRATHSL